MSGPRTPFTADEDRLLMKYIATYNPERPRRMGNVLYMRLVQDEEGKWPWSKRHSWQSWRERYKDNQYRFDAAIRKYQAKKEIRVHSSSINKSSPKLEKATKTVSSQSERTQQSAATGRASSSQNQKTNQMVVPKRTAEEIAGDVPIDERGEDEEISVSRRQQPEEFSRDRNPVDPVALKMARKSVVFPQVPDESGDDDEKEDKEEGAESHGSEGDDRPANDGKREAEDSRLAQQTKRRKIRQTENQADKENESEARPAQEAIGSAAKGTYLKDAASSQSSTVERSLELLKTLNKNGNSADINRQLELLTKLLGTESEDAQQVIALAKVFENLPSSFESGNTQSQELWYPRIEEQDRDFAGPAQPENVAPGSWKDGQAPTDGEPAKEMQNESGTSKSSAPGSWDVQQAKAEGHRGRSMSIDDRPVSQPRGRVARKVAEEDFFETPSPSPSPMKADKMEQSSLLEIVVSSSPRAQEPASSQNLEGRRSKNHTQLPKRDPPRYQNGGFRSTFAPSRRHVLPPGQPPDLDIDSDLSGTDIISDGDEPIKVMNKPQVMNTSRPPVVKKTVEPRHTQARSHTPRTAALPIESSSTIAQPSVQQKNVAPDPASTVAKYALSSVIDHAQVDNSAATPLVNSRKRNIGLAQSVISVSSSPYAPPTIPSGRRDSAVQTVPEENGNARKTGSAVRAGKKELQRFTSESKKLTRVASVLKSLNAEHNAISKDIKTQNVPPLTEKRKRKDTSWTSRKPQASSLSVAVGEVTGLKDSVLRSVPAGSLDRTDSIHAWRSEAQITSALDEDVSMTTMSDPFLTTDLARMLRQQEKAKGKETASAGKDSSTDNAGVRRDRRITFGGFTSAYSPQVDLRKRALRSSLASNQSTARRRLPFSPSSALAKEDEDNDVVSKSRRASVNVTIDLAQEVPSPHTEIPLTDQTFINRAGLQVLLQTIARNHRLALDTVLAVYEELMDLQATDHVCAEMRAAEVRAGEELIRRMKELRARSSTTSMPPSESEARSSHEPPHSASVRSSPERREADDSADSTYRFRSMSTRRRSELIIERQAASSPHASPAPRQLQRTVSTTWTSPEKSGPDVSIVSVDEARSLSGRRRSELFITPADDDPTYVRLREQYAPPSASRAARYLRRKARARLSSGLADNAQEDSMEVDQDQDNEKEEEEVTLALTQARSREDVPLASAEGFDESYRLQPAQADGSIDRLSQGAAPDTQSFTVEEDDILRGDDEDAIEEIIKKKGTLLVRLRMAELAQ